MKSVVHFQFIKSMLLRNNCVLNTALALCLGGLFTSPVLASEVVTHGHGALEVFDIKGMLATPLWVQLWIMFMMSMFITSACFIKTHSVARWVLSGFALGMICLSVLQFGLKIQPLSGLVALIHLIFWSPGLYQLLKTRPFCSGLIPFTASPFIAWSGVMTLTILFSFIFDIKDAAIYLHFLINH